MPWGRTEFVRRSAGDSDLRDRSPDRRDPWTFGIRCDVAPSMRLGRLVVLCAGAFAVFAALGGCSKPKEGAKCDAQGQTLGHGPGECIDKGSALVCVEGTFQKVKCDPAPIGCKKIAGSVSCNVITDEGEPCTSEKKVA